jgi:hypothetical protein
MIICCYHHQRTNYWFPMHMPQCSLCKLNAQALNTRDSHLKNQWRLKGLELGTTCYKLQVRIIIPSELQYIIVKRRRWWNVDKKTTHMETKFLSISFCNSNGAYPTVTNMGGVPIMFIFICCNKPFWLAHQKKSSQTL